MGREILIDGTLPPPFAGERFSHADDRGGLLIGQRVEQCLDLGGAFRRHPHRACSAARVDDHHAVRRL